MLAKEAVIKNIKEMPNEFSIDDLVERLLFIQSVEKGLEQDEEGKIMSTEELRNKLRK